MSDGNLTNPSIDLAEHVDENVPGKRVMPYYWDGSNWQRQGAGLTPASYDYIAYTPASTTDTYSYKVGGSSGTTVATIAVTWTDSTKTVLSNIART